MISISEAFSRAVIQMHGENGKAWLASLHERIASLKRRWKFDLLSPFESSYNYVAPVFGSEQGDAVLKACISKKEFENEINVLAFYSGAGMCKVIDYDTDQLVVLLERLNPGNHLTSIRDEAESVKIAASLIKTMKSKKVLPLHSFPTISDLADGIKNMRRYYAGQSSPFGETIIRKVEWLFPELISSQKEVYLLHGDLHHGNMLQSYSDWKLVDPKGVVGETEYELIPFLMNQLQTDRVGKIIDSRILLFRKELGIDIERTYAWGLCHSLLAAWWNIEDNPGIASQDLDIVQHFNRKIS